MNKVGRGVKLTAHHKLLPKSRVHAALRLRSVVLKRKGKFALLPDVSDCITQQIYLVTVHLATPFKWVNCGNNGYYQVN
jgi:hypothetical protein